MTSELNHQTTEVSFIDRLMRSRSSDLSQLGFTIREMNLNPVEDSSNLNQEISPGNSSSPDRVILINPATQDMVVIDSSSSINMDSLFNDFFSNEDGQPPASKSSIEAMKSVEISEVNTEGECLVCLEDWKVDHIVKEMPCKHKFHGECIKKWLEIHGTCPVCRYDMPVEDDHDNTRGRRRRREIWINFSIGNSSRRGSISGSSESSES